MASRIFQAILFITLRSSGTTSVRSGVEFPTEYSDRIMFSTKGKIFRSYIPVLFDFRQLDLVNVFEYDEAIPRKPSVVFLGHGDRTGLPVDARSFAYVESRSKTHVRIGVGPDSLLIRKFSSIDVLKPVYLGEGSRGRVVVGSLFEDFRAECVGESMATIPFKTDNYPESDQFLLANIRVSKLRSTESFKIVLDRGRSRAQLTLPQVYLNLIQSRLIEYGANYTGESSLGLSTFSNCSRSLLVNLPMIMLDFIDSRPRTPVMISPLDYVQSSRSICVVQLLATTNNIVVIQPFRIADMNFRITRDNITFCDNSGI
jgi:hypothetical protein